jgi:integrase
MSITLCTLVDDYYLSHDFKELRDATKVHYRYCLGAVLATNIDGAVVGEVDCSKLSTKQSKLAYDQWCDRGISTANHILAIARLLYNYALRMEHCFVNPFATVRRRTTQPRKVVWCREDVQRLLDAAYSDFSTRNIGLIAHMAYEWCQRVGDMRLLKWNAIDFEKRRVIILQSKRNAMVELPIDDDLYDMLVQQEKDFGFQEYVAPRPVPRHGVYAPYSQYKLPLHARKLMDDAGLSKELRLSDLRRTGVTEMVDAEVGIGQIMSVTGHANPQSVKPYLKNTFVSANNALTARKNV